MYLVRLLFLNILSNVKMYIFYGHGIKTSFKNIISFLLNRIFQLFIIFSKYVLNFEIDFCKMNLYYYNIIKYNKTGNQYIN